MKIAFTHNLQISDTEEEAEFDTPHTVSAISDALCLLGHQVDLVEVSGPASRLAAQLEALNPDMVFNTAEGRLGRYREAFYPALFDQLGLPYTGSDAYVCTLTMDKRLTKMTVAAHGVPTPRWMFVDSIIGFSPPDFTYPLMVKPNFEGSSKGIDMDSIVTDKDQLARKVADLVMRYPEGVLVEEFIQGKDVVVPFLEKGSRRTVGILAPSEYVFEESALGDRKYNIYDYTLKQTLSHAVSVRVPARIPQKVARELSRLSKIVYRVLGIRDLGRIDFRVTQDGRIYFIEVNALPSLEPGAAIYESARLARLETVGSVLNTVLKSAVERFGIQMAFRAKAKKRRKLRIGITFNLKRIDPKEKGEDDTEAEYDSQSTINAIKEAIASFGHEPVELEATPELPVLASAMPIDLVFNIAEGIQGRTRESQVPAILELLDIPYTGSDPATLAISLDKVLAKRIVRQAGILTPDFLVMRTGKERLPKNMHFPVIVKPVAEGSSKGVSQMSVMADEKSLRKAVAAMAAKYRQPMLVETYLPGREFTIGLLGETRPKVLPPMEIVYTKEDDPHPIYSFSQKLASDGSIVYQAPARIDLPLQRALERAAKGAFSALGCRDVARVDLRLDQKGRIHFIECNPLPGLTPEWSDLCIIAKGAGMSYRMLVGEIMAPAIRRLKAREKAHKPIHMH